MADLSPYHDENEDILSLRSNSHQAGEDDGDHPTKGPKEAERVKEGQEATKDAKEIQTVVRNLLFQAQNILPSSPGNHLVCASASPRSLGYDRLNSCLFSSFRGQLSNKISCKLFRGHLISQPS